MAVWERGRPHLILILIYYRTWAYQCESEGGLQSRCRSSSKYAPPCSPQGPPPSRHRRQARHAPRRHRRFHWRFSTRRQPSSTRAAILLDESAQHPFHRSFSVPAMPTRGRAEWGACPFRWAAAGRWTSPPSSWICVALSNRRKKGTSNSRPLPPAIRHTTFARNHFIYRLSPWSVLNAPCSERATVQACWHANTHICAFTQHIACTHACMFMHASNAPSYFMRHPSITLSTYAIWQGFLVREDAQVGFEHGLIYHFCTHTCLWLTGSSWRQSMKTC